MYPHPHPSLMNIVLSDILGFIVFLHNAYTPNEVENGEGASVDEYKGKVEMQ